MSVVILEEKLKISMVIIKLKMHPFGTFILVKKNIYMANRRTQKKLSLANEKGCS
jgi:hypothetical protein